MAQTLHARCAFGGLSHFAFGQLCDEHQVADLRKLRPQLAVRFPPRRAAQPFDAEIECLLRRFGTIFGAGFGWRDSRENRFRGRQGIDDCYDGSNDRAALDRRQRRLAARSTNADDRRESNEATQ
ncbi:MULTISPECIES: hypothetical protein [unclassified Caballeronia]|uniref:hypothetical protein n=1 Tax=unclassified Caballeronia TaxID=2646786 RepID=UPI002027B0B3|nr:MULTISPECIES: hypothetical protein [unclassified Caballeronia]